MVTGLINPGSKDSRDLSVRDMIQQLTKGRPYIFVIMAYKARYDLYRRLGKIAESEFKVTCIRADDIKSSGHDLLTKIHLLISRAELVIAEISDGSPNVYYEIGYAVGIQKSPLLLIEKGKEVPADLKGLEVIEHTSDRDGERIFDMEMADHLRLRMNSDLALLRDMLEAPVPEPAYIVTSPKYPGKHSRIQGQVYDTRTFGDHLGILGLISAFGLIRGERKGMELVSGQHCPPGLIDEPLSLYLIGSKKVNIHSEPMFMRLQGGKEPKWSLGPAPGYSVDDQDWPVALYRTRKGKEEEIRGKVEEFGPDKAEVWTEDYGIIIRGPHPIHPGRLVMIMAGAHSLGTGAACLAATSSVVIQKIRSKLPEGVLEDKTSTFWVLVKGTASSKDNLLDLEGVSVEDAGVYL